MFEFYASKFDLQSLMIDLKACFSNIRSGRLKLLSNDLRAIAASIPSLDIWDFCLTLVTVSSVLGAPGFLPGAFCLCLYGYSYLQLVIWTCLSVFWLFNPATFVLKVGGEICRVSPSPFGRSHRDVWNTRMYARSMNITLTAFHKDSLLC